MDTWLGTRHLCKRKILVVTGTDSYFNFRIRGWWLDQRKSQKIVDLNYKDKDFKHQFTRVTTPTLFSAPNAIVINEFPNEEKLEPFIEPFFEDDHSILIFAPTRKPDDKESAFLRRRSPLKMGWVNIDLRGRFDKRKFEFAKEVIEEESLIMEDRALRYLLDHSNWDLGFFENEVYKLSLLIEDKQQILGINYIHEVFPESVDKTRDLDNLMGGRLNQYFQELETSYQIASSEEQKILLNKHLRICEHIRILLLYDAKTEMADQYQALKKISKFPMSENQISYLVKNTRLSLVDCLIFLSRSCEWLQSSMMRRV